MRRPSWQSTVSMHHLKSETRLPSMVGADSLMQFSASTEFAHEQWLMFAPGSIGDPAWTSTSCCQATKFQSMSRASENRPLSEWWILSKNSLQWSAETKNSLLLSEMYSHCQNNPLLILSRGVNQQLHSKQCQQEQRHLPYQHLSVFSQP